jgi:gliding motility-associated-like protein
VTLQWSNSTETGNTLVVNSAGIYLVTVSTANGCDVISSRTITQDTTAINAAIINNTGTDQLSNGVTQINVTASPNGSGYSYAWSDETGGALGNNAALDIVAVGTYFVEVTGVNGCSDIDSITIVDCAIPLVEIINESAFDTLNCIDSLITLSAQGAATYVWQGIGSSNTVDITEPGIYHVTGTSSDGCTAQDSIIVYGDFTLPQAEIVYTGATVLSCAFDSAFVNATGGVSYSWNQGLGSSASIWVSSPALYVVEVVGANGCAAFDSIAFTADESLPQVTLLQSALELTCDTVSITITADTTANLLPVTLQWSNSTETGNTLVVDSAGSYAVTVTSSNDCSVTTSIVVNSDTLVSFSLLAEAELIDCNNPSILLTAGNAQSYEWSILGVGVLVSEDTLLVSAAGEYHLEVQEANGCVGDTSITIQANFDLPTVSIVNNSGSDSLTCATETISLSAAGNGVGYVWSDGLGSSSVVSIDEPGSYLVTATGTNGCVAADSIEIFQDESLPSLLVLNAGGIDTLTCEHPTTLLVAIGDGDLLWSAGLGSSDSVIVAAAGQYLVTLTSANGCSITDSILVNESFELPIVAISAEDSILTCDVSSIILEASGGVSYSWSQDNVQLGGGQNLTVNQPGTYTVSATSAIGCVGSTSYTVTADGSQPQLNLDALTNELNCLTSQIELNATGDLGTLTWSVDGDGCPGTPDPTLICTADFNPVCGCDGITYSNPCYAETAGVLNYIPGECDSIVGQSSITINNAGTYTVTLEDANGCEVSASITIVENLETPYASVASVGDICSNENAEFTLSGTAGDEVTYMINDGAQQTITIGSAGTEVVSIPTPADDVTLQLIEVSRGNCIELLDGIATVIVTPAPTAVAGEDVVTCAGFEIETNAGIVPNAEYAWQGPNGFESDETNIAFTSPTVDASGEYYLSVSVGVCTDTDTVNIAIWPTYVNTLPIVSVCAGGQDYDLPNGETVFVDADITYEFNLQTVMHQCDSIVVISFDVLDPIETEGQEISLCNGYSWDFGNGVVADSSGIYVIPYESINGCDSLVSFSVVEIPEIEPVYVPLEPRCAGEQVTLPNGDIVDSSDVYSVTLTSFSNCDSIVNYSVVILPELESSFAAYACFGEAYTLPNGDLVYDTDTYPVLLEGQGQFGCDSTVHVTLTFTPPVMVSIIPEVDSLSICSGDSLLLIADGAPTFNWDSANPLSANEGAVIEAYPTQSGYINVEGSNLGCESRDSIYINVYALPEMQIIAPDAICMGETVTISAIGSDSLMWMNADILGCPTCPEIEVSPIEQTVFMVGGWNDQCYGTTSFVMDVQEVPVASTYGDTLVCAYSSADLFAMGGESYIWSTGETTAAISVEPGETTVYQVVAISGICSDTALITVEALPLPQITSNNDTTISLGGQVQLFATGGVNYSWSPATDLSCTACANPIAIPSESITYCVEALSDRGCSDTACVRIEVIDECETFFIPNAFAPERGGDEMNDCFRPFGDECFTSMRMRVFDRWGEMVFESTDFESCWDGTYQGKKVNSGVFVYYFDGVLINGNPFYRKGNVTVIR